MSIATFLGSAKQEVKTWAKERELTSLCTNLMWAMARREYRPIGMLMSMAFAPDAVALTPEHPLLQPGRDCTVRWETDTAPLLCESNERLILAHPMGVLPLTLDREHPTERGSWEQRPTMTNAQGEDVMERIWIPDHKLYDDASKVTGENADPRYPYMSVKEEDPRRMISQMHADGVTPLVAGGEVRIGTPDGRGRTFFLCQPVIQMTVAAAGPGGKLNLIRLDISADNSGRQMAFLYPLLQGETAAPAFLVYGQWRGNSREDGN